VRSMLLLASLVPAQEVDSLVADNQVLSSTVLQLQHSVGIEQAANARLHMSLCQLQVCTQPRAHPHRLMPRNCAWNRPGELSVHTRVPAPSPSLQ
jgi:hypothetical protein